MADLFFNIDYTTLTAMLVKIVIFTVITMLLLYAIYFVLTKTLFRKSRLDRTITLRLTFLWAIFTCLIVFNIYIAILFYHNGIDTLQWTNPKFYLGIMAQLFVYVGLATCFFVKRHSYKKEIKNNSIN